MSSLSNPLVDDVIYDHIHPVLNRILPSARFRRGGMNFGSAAAAQNVVIGLSATPVTYTFVAALGAPAAANVQVLVQGTMDLTVRKLAQAIQGVTDPTNIAYGTGTKPHPDISAWYTSQAFCVNTTQQAAGSNLIFKEKVGDQTDAAAALTCTTTTIGSTIIAFTRVYSHRYLMTGNAAALGNRIAGGYQVVLPMGYIVDPATGVTVKFDPEIVITEAVVAIGRIIEMDLYYSTDEVTFTLINYGLNLSMSTATAGSDMHINKGQRCPAGAGLYTVMRSDGTVNTDWVNYKVHVHQYPPGV